MPGPYKPKPSRRPEPRQQQKNDEQELRINNRITAPQVRLVGENIPEQGIYPIAKALRLADELGRDQALINNQGRSLRPLYPTITKNTLYYDLQQGNKWP